ncbi:MAG: GntR family transcriptional regulator [Steroidobacteraceae bacterium]
MPSTGRATCPSPRGSSSSSDRGLADSLPRVRRLALDLGVHFNTVAQAYRALADQGWIEIAHRSGARVISRMVRC